MGLRQVSAVVRGLLPWSALVWPLHRRRSRDRRDWPPELGVEIWQTALGLVLLALAVFVAAWVTDHDLFEMLFVPVSFLATAVGGGAALFLSFRAVQGSWDRPGDTPGGEGD